MSTADIWLFLQQGVLSGLVSGSVYALLAIAIVIVFNTSDIPNFAQGELFMAGAYLALFLVTAMNWPYLLVVFLVVVGIAVVGALFQGVVMQQVERSRGVSVQFVIATLGLAYLLRGIVRLTGLGDVPRSLPSLFSGGIVQIGQAVLVMQDVAILVGAVTIMLVLYAFFRWSRTGKAMRAVGVNPRAAQLVGVSLARMRMRVWALAGVLSAFAALLIAPKVLVTPDIAELAIIAFAAAIIGGFSSLPGAVLGGFLIGIAQNLVGLFISTNAIVVTPFVAIMLVLLLRPQGLLGGKPQVKKV